MSAAPIEVDGALNASDGVLALGLQHIIFQRGYCVQYLHLPTNLDDGAGDSLLQMALPRDAVFSAALSIQTPLESEGSVQVLLPIAGLQLARTGLARESLPRPACGMLERKQVFKLQHSHCCPDCSKAQGASFALIGVSSDTPGF